MTTVAPPSPWRAAAFALAGGGSVGLAWAGLHPGVAAGLAGAWALAGWPVLGPLALTAALPAAALLPGGGLPALAGWSVAAAAAATGLALVDEARYRTAARRVQDELRDAEHERQVLQSTIERYPVLMEACLELSAARDLDRFAMTLCERARGLLPEAREVLVHLGRGRQITCRAGLDATGKPTARDPGEDEIYVANEARPLTRRDGPVLRCLLPLRGDRRRDEAGAGAEPVRGVLSAGFQVATVGDRVAIELLAALARIGGLGLAAVDLVDQARGLALHDDLTGLFGRHEFLRRLDEQIAQARRQGEALMVAMCDMDRLKAYNDRYGHPAGDAALRAVAGAMRATLPAGAIACRWGGEEFAFLAAGHGEAAALQLGDEVRRAIAAALPDPAHPERRVTASIGVAVMRADEGAKAALVRADAACYRAKAEGRDRVSSAADIPGVSA
jgi:diguanylate cyclase (GGDEF)-like protein